MYKQRLHQDKQLSKLILAIIIASMMNCAFALSTDKPLEYTIQ